MSLAYSSAAERLTVNQNVPGSIPGGPVTEVFSVYT